jgi:hypothetical protein
MPRMRACHRWVREAPATGGSAPLTDTSKKKERTESEDPFKSLEHPAKKELRQAHARRESR